ncbi:Uncharacterised protein [uncultured archaeon]|nr:Uncharacterised protein [uncultured archaeon]
MAMITKEQKPQEEAERKPLEYGAVLVKDAGRDKFLVARVSQVPKEGEVKYQVVYNYISKTELERARKADEGNNDSNMGQWINRAIPVWYGATGVIGPAGTKNDGKLIITPPAREREGDRPRGFRGESFTPGDIKQVAALAATRVNEEVVQERMESEVRTRGMDKGMGIARAEAAEIPKAGEAEIPKAAEVVEKKRRGEAQIAGTTRMLQENNEVRFTYEPSVIRSTPKRVMSDAEMEGLARSAKPEEAAHGEEREYVNGGPLKKAVVEDVARKYEKKFANRYSELRNKEGIEGLTGAEKEEMGDLYDALTSKFKLKMNADGTFASKKLNDIADRQYEEYRKEWEASMAKAYKRDEKGFYREKATTKAVAAEKGIETRGKEAETAAQKEAVAETEIMRSQEIAKLAGKAAYDVITSMRKEGKLGAYAEGIRPGDVKITGNEAVAVGERALGNTLVIGKIKNELIRQMGERLRAGTKSGDVAFVFGENGELAGIEVRKPAEK